jgi:hypothetical protein
VRKTIEDIVLVVKRQAKLLQMILALRPASGLTSLLHGGQQKRYKNGNDGNHDKEFDQCKAVMATNAGFHFVVFQVAGLK